MSMRRCVGVLLGLGALTSACGSDPAEPVTGALELTISTTGMDLDPDGYTVTVDAGSPLAVPVNGTVSIPNLEPGVHTVTLAGLASNCALTTPTPLEITVPGGEGAVANVKISCTAIYTLAYQGPSGVELTDAAGTVHRTLVPDGRPLAWSPDGRLLAVGKGKAVWLANVDDGGLSPFVTDTNTSTQAGYPFTAGSWSPDGRELLLERPDDYISHTLPQYLTRWPLDRSYSGQTIFMAPAGPFGCPDLGAGLRGYTWPDWSPDGNQIVANSCSLVDILSPDGSTRRRLVNGRQPDWSPDGSAIVYVAGPYTYSTIGVAPLHWIHPDGSGDRQLTAPAPNETDQDPAWSPDGAKVAFVRLGLASDSTVALVHAYVVERDGTNERQLAVLPGVLPGNDPTWLEARYLAHPAWSPDGLHLVYSGLGGTYVVNADGSGFRLVSDAEAYVPALWRP